MNDIRDIDLLIEEQDLNQVYEIFKINGYRADNASTATEDETTICQALLTAKM